MKETVLITGATSGIGEATARLLAGRYRLIICGRRLNRLENLRSELSGKTDVHVLCFDVSDKKAAFQAIETLPDAWKSIDVLINNAGNAHGFDLFQDADTDDWDAMIDINVKGLLYVTKAIVHGMIARKKGHIINMGSVAGIEVYLRGAVYSASKFAVDAISRGMRQDLIAHGIKVTEIKPGLVETEFSQVRFKGDEEKARQVYQGMTPLTAHDIAEVIEFAVTRPAHVNIADLLIFPTAQATATMVNRKKSS